MVVITDRRILDEQIRETIRKFAQVSAVIGAVGTGSDSNTKQLTRFFADGKKIIISTVQTFPFVLDEIGSDHRSRSFAIIIDEAHSSQGSRTSAKLNMALSGEEDADEEESVARKAEVMALLRDGSWRLTAEVYQDEALLPLGQAMKSLPALNIGNASRVEPCAEAHLAATGTDGPTHSPRLAAHSRSKPRADLREVKSPPARQVPPGVPDSGLSLALPGTSEATTSIEQTPQRPPGSPLGNVGHDVEKCGRQESNLHGLSATGT